MLIEATDQAKKNWKYFLFNVKIFPNFNEKLSRGCFRAK